MYTASGSCVSFYPSCSLVCVLKTENFLTMEALRALPIHSLHSIPTKLAKTQSKGPFFLNFRAIPSWSFSSPHQQNGSKSKLYTATPSSVSTEPTDPPQELETQIQNVKFDWYSQWYPILPVCDLDKRKPHGKKVMGIDLVVWWDRNESAWKVFDDTCPHRLAPLSEGRIDQWGRLQCVYHGWCFNGSGDCKFIPQAPPDGPPFHTFKKACVAAYPSTVQNDIVWFWPNTDPKYKDILKEQRPPYIPEIDDPSFTKLIGNRDFPYGYDVLIDNLMDPAHVAYAHYGIARVSKPKIKADREGGRPLELSLQKLDINGFISRQEVGHSVFGFISREEVGHGVFIPPCVYHFSFSHPQDQDNGAASSAGTKRPPAGKRISLVLICVPVSPGTSRLIWVFPRNFGTWIDKIVPRWMFHVVQNLILDSDLYLLHVEERKIMDIGPENWEKGCFTPTKSDAQVIGFRKWLIKYSNGQVDWRGKFNGAAPPTPRREQLMDRYWSHVVNCRSCSAAYKSLNVLEVVLKLVSITIIGIVAATKQSMTSVAVRSTAVSVAVLCYAASRWLAHFIYKNFHFHDYDHAFR